MDTEHVFNLLILHLLVHSLVLFLEGGGDKTFELAARRGSRRKAYVFDSFMLAVYAMREELEDSVQSMQKSSCAKAREE